MTITKIPKTLRVVLFFLIVFELVHLVFNNGLVASWTANVLQHTLRGKFDIESVHWNRRIVIDLLTGQPTAIDIHNYRSFADDGTPVISVDHARAYLHLWGLFNGNAYVSRFEADGVFVSIHNSKTALHHRGNPFIALAHAYTPPPKDKKSQNVGGRGGFRLSVHGIRIRDARFSLNLYDTMVEARGIDLDGYYQLRSSMVERDMLVATRFSADSTVWTQSGIASRFSDIAAHSARISRDTLFGHISATHAGEDLDLTVRIDQLLSGVDMRLYVEGDVSGLQSIIASRLRDFPSIPGLTIGLMEEDGDTSGSHAHFRIDGPIEQPNVDLSIAGISASYRGKEITGLGMNARLDTHSNKLSLSGFRAKLFGGEVTAKVDYDLGKGHWRGQLMTHGLDLNHIDPLLSGPVDASLDFDGSVGHLVGTYIPRHLHWKTLELDADLKLDNQNIIVSKSRLNAKARRGRSDHLSFGGVIDLGRQKVRGNTQFYLAQPVKGLTQLVARLASSGLNSRLARSLGDLKGNAVIESIQVDEVQGRASISGSTRNPFIQGKLSLQDLSYDGITHAGADLSLSYGNKRLNISNMHSKDPRLAFKGKGHLSINDNFARSQLDLRVELQNTDIGTVAKMMGQSSPASGHLDAKVHIGGPVTNLTVSGKSTISSLNVAKNQFKPIQSEFSWNREKGVKISPTLLSQTHGGRIALEANDDDVLLHFDNAVFRFTQDQAGIAKLLGGVEVKGLTGDLKIKEGFISSRITGRSVALTHGNTERTVMKNISLYADPVEGGSRVHFWSQDKQVDIRGELDERLGKSGNAMIVLSDTELVDFAQMIFRSATPGETIFSGQIAGKGMIAWTESGIEEFNARIHASSISLSQVAGFRLRKPMVIRPIEDMRVRYDRGQTMAIDPIALEVSVKDIYAAKGDKVETGRVTMSATLEDSPVMSIKGQLPLSLSKTVVPMDIQTVSGGVSIDARISPQSDQQVSKQPILNKDAGLGGFVVDGKISLENAVLTDLSGSHRFAIPLGRLRVDNHALVLEPTRLLSNQDACIVEGIYRFNDRRVAKLRDSDGSNNGSHSKPAVFPIEGSAKGRLSLAVFEPLLTGWVARLNGTTDTDLKIRGSVSSPKLFGSLIFEDVDVLPRAIGRTISIKTGMVSFDGDRFCFGGRYGSSQHVCEPRRRIQGKFDEGDFSIFGEVRAPFDDPYVSLDLTGQTLPLRSANSFHGELDLDVQLKRSDSRSVLSGQVAVSDFFYSQEFDVIQKVIRPKKTVTSWSLADSMSSLPRWLRETDLDLGMISRNPIEVRNQWSRIALSPKLSVNGTIEYPKLSGRVLANEGWLTVPFLRGRYRLKKGLVLFSEDKEIQEGTVSVRAFDTFSSNVGVDYRVFVNITGPLEEMNIELESRPALTQNKILALINTGVIPGVIVTDDSSNPVRDQLANRANVDSVASVTGGIFGSALEMPLRRATGLDLIRLELGKEEFTARGCKRFGSRLNLCGEYNKNYFGTSGGSGILNFRILEYLRLVGNVDRLATRFEREQETPTRGRLQLKYRIPVP